jgi:hypothetical protein
MGWIHPRWGMFIALLGLLYVLWELYPAIQIRTKRNPHMSLVVSLIIGAFLGAAIGYVVWRK